MKTSEQNEFFKQAEFAAVNYQPKVMIKALFVSGFIDGLVRRLVSRWKKLPSHEIEVCVAEAVLNAFIKVSGNGRISNLGGWLWKSAFNNAYMCWQKHYKGRASKNIDVENYQDADSFYTVEDEYTDERREEIRREAVRLARSLILRIGGGQIEDVMEMVIDAVDKGISDLSPQEIGDALGISPDSVRQLLSRGFNRLRREAQKDGIELPDVLSSNGLWDE